MCQELKKLAELEVRNFCVVISTRVIAIKQEVISLYGIWNVSEVLKYKGQRTAKPMKLAGQKSAS